MTDFGVRVMAGIGWAFAVLNLAPELVTFLVSNNYLPVVATRSPAFSEVLYLIGLAALGPLVLWLASRRRRAREWKAFEE